MNRKTPTLTPNQVAKFRRELGVSQTEFAAILGHVRPGAKTIVSKMELGNRRIQGPVARLIQVIMQAHRNGSVAYSEILNEK